MFTPKLHGETMPRRAKSFKSYACAKLHPPWKMLNEAHFGRFHGFTWFHHDGLEPLRKHTVVCRLSVFCKPLGSWPLSVPQNTGQLAAATTCSHDKLPEPLTSVNLSRYDPQSSPATFPNFQLLSSAVKMNVSQATRPNSKPKASAAALLPVPGPPQKSATVTMGRAGPSGRPEAPSLRPSPAAQKGHCHFVFCAKNVCACTNDLTIHHESQNTIHSRNYTKYYVLYSMSLCTIV